MEFQDYYKTLGVKQGAAVPDLAADANTTTANAKINALLAQLRAAGVIAA